MGVHLFLSTIQPSFHPDPAGGIDLGTDIPARHSRHYSTTGMAQSVLIAQLTL